MGNVLLLDGDPVLDGDLVIVPTGEDAADCECCDPPGECCEGCPSIADITIDWQNFEVEFDCTGGETFSISGDISQCGLCQSSGESEGRWLAATLVSTNVDSCPTETTCWINYESVWTLWCVTDSEDNPLWALEVVARVGFHDDSGGGLFGNARIYATFTASRSGSCPPASGWTFIGSTIFTGPFFCSSATLTDTGTIAVAATVGNCEGDEPPADCDDCEGTYTASVTSIDVDEAPCFYTQFSSTMICDPNACNWEDDPLGLRSVSGNSSGCCDCSPANKQNGSFSISVFCDGSEWVATAAIFCDHFDDTDFQIIDEDCWPVILEMMWRQSKGQEDCPPSTGWGDPTLFSFGNETLIVADTGKATFTLAVT